MQYSVILNFFTQLPIFCDRGGTVSFIDRDYSSFAIQMKRFVSDGKDAECTIAHTTRCVLYTDMCFLGAESLNHCSEIGVRLFDM